MVSLYHILTASFLLRTCLSAQYGAMNMPDGLSPRFYLGLPPQLEERQAGGCAADAHSCLDINSTVCCLDTQYCYIDPNNSPKCCAIGSLCDSNCPASQYQCGNITTTVSGTATVSASCCGRACPSTSAFLCAAEYGGGCCSYGFACASSGKCESTATSSMSAIVSEVPTGCTASQIACPSSVGGGCCNYGLSCTVVDKTNYCGSATGTALRTGPNGAIASNITETSTKSGLSTGAKAGIGVAIAIAVATILGALLWFCVVHRRRAKQEGDISTTADMSETATSYFGAASPGFEKDVPLSPAGPGDITTPIEIDSREHSNMASPGFDKGVPLSPVDPGDITTPIEIDSREHSNMASPGFIGGEVLETTVARAELPTTVARVELP